MSYIKTVSSPNIVNVGTNPSQWTSKGIEDKSVNAYITNTYGIIHSDNFRFNTEGLLSQNYLNTGTNAYSPDRYLNGLYDTKISGGAITLASVIQKPLTVSFIPQSYSVASQILGTSVNLKSASNLLISDSLVASSSSIFASGISSCNVNLYGTISNRNEKLDSFYNNRISNHSDVISLINANSLASEYGNLNIHSGTLAWSTVNKPSTIWSNGISNFAIRADSLSSYGSSFIVNDLLSTSAFNTSTVAVGNNILSLNANTNRFAAGTLIPNNTLKVNNGYNGLDFDVVRGNFNILKSENLFASSNISIQSTTPETQLSRIADYLEKGNTDFEYSDRSMKFSVEGMNITINVTYNFNYTNINIKKSIAHLGPNISFK